MEFILSAFADEASNDLDEQLQTLKFHDIHKIELRNLNGKGCKDLTLEEAKQVKEKLEAQGISLSSLGSPYGKINIQDDFAPHFEEFLHGLKITKALGGNSIRMFSFFMPKDKNPLDYKEKVFERLEKMLEAAQKENVQLLHENEKDIFGDTKERCLMLMEQFKGRLGLIFDPANFIQSGEDVLEAYEMLKPYITYMHIKDAIKADGAVVTAGSGEGHIKDILKDIKNTRKEGMILTLEPHLTVFRGLQSLQTETLVHHMQFASQQEAFSAAVQALKNIIHTL